MLEDYEEFISLTLRTRSSKKPKGMLERNWKHQWLPLCLMDVGSVGCGCRGFGLCNHRCEGEASGAGTQRVEGKKALSPKPWQVLGVLLFRVLWSHSGGYDVLDTGEMGPAPHVATVEGFAGCSWYWLSPGFPNLVRMPLVRHVHADPGHCSTVTRGFSSQVLGVHSLRWGVRSPILGLAWGLAALRGLDSLFSRGRPKTKVQFWSVRFAQNACALRRCHRADVNELDRTDRDSRWLSYVALPKRIRWSIVSKKGLQQNWTIHGRSGISVSMASGWMLSSQIWTRAGVHSVCLAPSSVRARSAHHNVAAGLP